jgi:phospholipid transport system transporter-binding protein
MSICELTDLGDSRFALRGDLSFDTVEQILRASKELFNGQTNIEVDLSGVEKTDSAGLALLLEWISWSAISGIDIRFAEMPEKLLAIAQTTEVDGWLRRSYSSSSKK